MVWNLQRIGLRTATFGLLALALVAFGCDEDGPADEAADTAAPGDDAMSEDLLGGDLGGMEDSMEADEASPPDMDPIADWGDAPDEQPSFYRGPGAAAMGHFPTRAASDNCRVSAGASGAHGLDASSLGLGDEVSPEAGPADPEDPDGVANEIDDDRFDDSLRGIWSGTPGS